MSFSKSLMCIKWFVFSQMISSKLWWSGNYFLQTYRWCILLLSLLNLMNWCIYYWFFQIFLHYGCWWNIQCNTSYWRFRNQGRFCMCRVFLYLLNHGVRIHMWRSIRHHFLYLLIIDPNRTKSVDSKFNPVYMAESPTRFLHLALRYLFWNWYKTIHRKNQSD